MITIVEALGVLCPVPIIRLARVAATLPPGSLVALLTDDPAAEHDVPAWCRLRGHALLASEPVTSPTSPWAGGAAPGAAPGGPGTPEPEVPNPSPAQPVRHLIRLGTAPAGSEATGAASSGTPHPSTGGSGNASASSRR